MEGKKDDDILNNFKDKVRVIANSEDSSSFGDFVPIEKHGKCGVTRITGL